MPDRHPVFLFFALLLAVAQPTAWAQTVPPMLPYTGTIAVKDAPPFNNNGQFKFTIVSGECQATPPDGCASFWSNDNTSAAGSEPTAAVTIPVTNGVFAVKLGDTNLGMSAIPSTVFNNATTFLRVWFSDDGTTFEQLSPDRQLVSVPYAYQAETAGSVTGTGVVGPTQIAAGAIGSTQIDNAQVQTRVSGTCLPGNSIRIVNDNGTVECQADNVGITAETDPTAVTRQATTPGTAQSGNLNITGTGIFNNNVGIGTTTPLAKLHVTGGSVVSGTGTVGGALNSTQLIGAGTAFLTEVSVGDILTTGVQARSVVSVSDNITLAVDRPWSSNVLSASYTIRKPIQKTVRSDNSLAVIVNGEGNVGIGTPSPGGKLDVSGNALVLGQAVSSNFKYVTGFIDWRNNAGCCSAGVWNTTPGRVITYNKTRADSLLRIQYNDTLGYYGAVSYDACHWRIQVDATQVLFFSSAPDTQDGVGWRMQNATHTAIAPNFGVGTHTIRVQNLRNTATECLQGWNQTGNILTVEEVGP